MTRVVSLFNRRSCPEMIQLLLFVLVGFSHWEQVYSWKAQWIATKPLHKIQPRRSGHVAFHIDTVPFVFGGYVEEDDNDETNKNDQKSTYHRYVTNDLWRWENETMQWQQVETIGEIPQSRLVATASVLNDKCYLMGGWDPQIQGTGGIILDTVHCWDNATRQWSCLSLTMPDGPTSRHVAISLSNQILVHTHRCQGYVLLFDPKTISFQQQMTTGHFPSSRGLHAATRLNHHQVLFFGGASQSGDMSNEVFLLDTNTWQWKVLTAQGPTARAGSCLVRVDDQTALLFGGAEVSSTGLKPRGDVWLLHVNENRWELLVDDDNEQDSEVPPPRNAATLSILADSTNEKTFLLTGGWQPFVRTHDDCFLLKLTKS